LRRFCSPQRQHGLIIRSFREEEGPVPPLSESAPLMVNVEASLAIISDES